MRHKEICILSTECVEFSLFIMSKFSKATKMPTDLMEFHESTAEYTGELEINWANRK